MEQHWFRAKTYGYGWYPATWQGWLCLLIYILLVGVSTTSNTVYFHQVQQNIVPVICEIVFYTLVLLFVCYRTGEKAEWRWGKKKI